jgi:signal transduction histidine kinase
MREAAQVLMAEIPSGEIVAQLYPQVERLIALARLGLASISLLALWLDPSEPGRYAQIAYSLLAGYVGYALIMAWPVWRSPTALVRLRFFAQAFDLAIFTLFIHFTGGPTSPFVVYFVFALVCATLRWLWYGTLWTGLLALAAFIGMGVYTAEILRDPAFELNRFVIHSLYLVVVTMLVGYLAVYEQRQRREIAALATWPTTLPGDVHTLVRDVLEHAAVMLDARRLLMAWEDRGEPWLHLASLSRGKFCVLPESAATVHPLVVEAVTGTSFLCWNVQAAMPVVYHTSPSGVQRWDGIPLHPELQARFDIDTVLALRLHGESLKGYLLALGKSHMTTKDLTLGEIVAHRMAAHMDQFYFSQQHQHAAIARERFRFARDLHDGLLQSLSSANYRLEALHHLAAGELPVISERVQETQHLLTAALGDLRMLIEDLRPGSPRWGEASFNLIARLGELCERIERHWGLRVDWRQGHELGEPPEELGHEIYFIIHEAMINAARHAKASALHVELHRQPNHWRIVLQDNGRGFPFRGHYDLPTLLATQLGPRTLKERIVSLGGDLVIDSSASGARLEITLPLPQSGGQDADSSRGCRRPSADPPRLGGTL